ncbi:hypothetical protein [Nocardioides psychrotolerans]|uniref:Uncharacterized protein n=1 Tax=Nocardioides psychrotolerans TaxID=1005945 RepID=A0A1I3NHB9_9ACTN|nr:hypothetical protein [Nocardioides psychrotolerans]SFJ08567.1 hypothetical protein SAMN05216561_1183 [Nocardioides psychrotolerans]
MSDPRPAPRTVASYTERHRGWSLTGTVLGLLLAGSVLGGGAGLAATHVISLALDQISSSP